jgi:hypothetical protein
MRNEIVSKTIERGINIMSHMKSIFVVLLLTAIVGLVPQAQAITPETIISGSSALWQSTALAAFKIACPTYPAACATTKGITAGHWTSASNAAFLLDTRFSPAVSDAGTIWVVWNAGATKVWAFNKVDSVVGDRCYFAVPRCTFTQAVTEGEAGAGKIATSLWGADSGLPETVAELISAGTPVNVSATDIRPEDAAFAACRVNSDGPVNGGASGAGAYAGAASDGLDGLGYNANNLPGQCPANGLGAAAPQYHGTSIVSTSGSTFNVLSFNISGVDPVTGGSIPSHTVVRIGADPIVFVDQRKNLLAGVTNATDAELQKVFSGNCDASNFVGGVAGGINVFIREPLSGTYNTTEATVMRKPDVYNGSGGGPTIGHSMETGVIQNPLDALNGANCASTDNNGGRYRAIGTSQEVADVQTFTGIKGGIDGIGFTFFSYGNVGPIAGSVNYGYVQLNGVDPIFAKYNGGDPGQPATAGNAGPNVPGTLPAAANLPAATCPDGFPCPENDIWAGGLSFPTLRSGDYSAWSILRLVSNGAGLTAADALVKAAESYTVGETPDYVPISKTTVNGFTDPGLLLLRSHYQQYDGAGVALGAAPVNKGTTEAGGDMGGCIVKSSGSTSTKIQFVNGNYPDYLYPNCATRPGGE